MTELSTMAVPSGGASWTPQIEYVADPKSAPAANTTGRAAGHLKLAASAAVGETANLLAPLSTPIEAPAKGIGGCSTMIELSPTARRARRSHCCFGAGL